MASTEEVYKTVMVTSRSGGRLDVPNGGLTGSGGGGVRYVKLRNGDGKEERETTAEDVRRMAVEAGADGVGEGKRGMDVDVERKQDVGSKRDIVRFQSEVVVRGGTRLLSQRKPSAGAEYRRRRTTSDPSKFGGGGPLRHGSLREFTQDVHHAASETYLITRLALTLLKLLGVGTRWISKFIRLGLYAMCLMPGFIQVGFFYYFDPRVHRSIIYGDQPRNRFDLYLPPETDKPKPVVIFVTGGAWVIGYKAWGSLLAQELLDCDIIVACIDYRNFPQGSISHMISDVSTGIGYVFQNLESYGGDPNMVYLAGQSAGAHLATCALLMQAEKEINEDSAKLSWRSSQINACMAISGGYNLAKLVDHFHKRGLYKSIFLSMMEGEHSLPVYSPQYMVMTPGFRKAVPLLPPINLYHGTADYSIPHEASEKFADALQLVGAHVKTTLYPNKTHTDLFLQDPMRGGTDELLTDILAIVHANDEEARAEDIKKANTRRRLVPEFLLQLARTVSPF
ncbi:hypothetical protein M758_3G120400 [Ceratodon purpureus]|uniref:protein-S-isoprenylcysteine alpha-carbonyl methylesterase n=1 Tax=Ceratodon purpureus TaxID=3225 RepID=A0A8T0IJU3_CERPU|nr:hypothetical protein KC19_3G118900 [Ceratodon purpureus]KAG0622744.1 hypothetical protein M758_3G120400 [Ceratodon purpureus]